MISRKTARVITETYEEESAYSKPKYYSGSGTHGYETTIYTHQLNYMISYTTTTILRGCSTRPGNLCLTVVRFRIGS
jgi:hypothetical protein